MSSVGGRRGCEKCSVVPNQVAVLIVCPVTVLVSTANKSDGPVVAIEGTDHDPDTGRLLVRREDGVPVGHDARFCIRPYDTRL